MATAKKTTTRSKRASAGTQEGPRYRLLKDSVIDNELKPTGAEVTYYGEPGSALYPLNAEAKSRKTQVRDIRRDSKLDAAAKLAELKELSDEWNGVEAADDFADGDDFDDAISDSQRAEYEKHAAAAVEATRDAEQDNTNKVRVQLQGDPSDPEGKKSRAGLQGDTPVTDGKSKK